MTPLRWFGLAGLVAAASASLAVLVHMCGLDSASAGVPEPAVAPADPYGVGRPVPPSSGPSGKLSLEGGEGDSPREVAFGSMAHGETGSRAITLRNSGEGELRLAKGSTSCGCTVAGFGEGTDLSPEAVLQPGETTRLTLQWTPKKPGAFQSHARILTSDPDRAEVEFTIKGQALAAIATVPADATFRLGQLAEDESKSATMRLWSLDRPDFQILAVRSSRPELVRAIVRAVSAGESDSESAGGYEIELTVSPAPGLGPFREELVVTTDHPKKPELRIPVTGERVGPISVLPKQVRILAGPEQGGKGQAVLSVRGQDLTRFEVAEAPEGVTVAIEPAVADAAQGHSHSYRLTASIAPGAAPGRIRGAITLKTDHPAAGTVKIPVSIMVVGAKNAG
jgi:hypothetical protein